MPPPRAVTSSPFKLSFFVVRVWTIGTHHDIGAV